MTEYQLEAMRAEFEALMRDEHFHDEWFVLDEYDEYQCDEMQQMWRGFQAARAAQPVPPSCGWPKCPHGAECVHAMPTPTADGLPELPEPCEYVSAVTEDGQDREVAVFREHKMRAYARQAFELGRQQTEQSLVAACNRVGELESWKDEMQKERDEALQQLAALRSMVSSPQQAVPHGWKLVPVEPTNTMMMAGYEAQGEATHPAIRSAWGAMLAAAPKAVKK